MNRKSISSNCNATKFLYSYGGKILPRRPDGKLRYVGGHTRVLSVDSSITFAELMIKFGELCGESMRLRCKLPSDDLDVLISIKSEEDLRNVMEEYEHFSSSTHQEMKIRAILLPVNFPKKVSPPTSPMSCFDFPTPPLPRPNSKPSSPHTAAIGCSVSGVRRVGAASNGVRHGRVYYKNSQWHYCQ